jgi:hypothetical protein
VLRVRVLGAGVVCHTGSKSCFTQELQLGPVSQISEEGMRR